MTTRRVVDEVRAELEELAVPGRADKEKAYLKSWRTFLGVPVPACRKVARAWTDEQPADRTELWPILHEAWSRDVHELCAWTLFVLEMRTDLDAEDLDDLERLLRQCDTWALLDVMAANIIGPLAREHDADRIDRWLHDESFWVRRAGILADLGRLRRGEGDLDAWAASVDHLWEEKEFFIRKALGWVLRETSKQDAQAVAALVDRVGHRMSGLTRREALKYVD